LTSRRFSIWVASIVGILGLTFTAFNLWEDDFGLFWSNAPKRIWDQERTSKYLMSFRYIPNHFDGLLLGPSYSDRLDTRRLDGYRTYNLSVDGADATELRTLALNVIERGDIKFIILCLDPYLTLSVGLKGDQINQKEYWGSLFSLLPIRIVRAKLAARLRPGDDVWADSTWGYEARYSKSFTWDEFVKMESEEGDVSDVHINPIAYQQLRDIIDSAHRHGIRVLAFVLPANAWYLRAAVDSGKWDAYIARTKALFDSPRDVFWDMTVSDYAALRRDPSCYTDRHASRAGARLILADIKSHLDWALKGISTPPVFPLPRAFACFGQEGSGSGYDRAIPPSDALEQRSAPPGL
jgi:hypothetical protein